MTREELLRKMKTALAEVSDTVDWESITEDDRLIDDLGFDSLTIMLVSIKLEDEFKVTIPDSAEINTVGDVCRILEQ